MQHMCETCSRQKFCGNVTTTGYCTGYMPQVATRWTTGKDIEADEQFQRWIDEHNRQLKEKHNE